METSSSFKSKNKSSKKCRSNVYIPIHITFVVDMKMYTDMDARTHFMQNTISLNSLRLNDGYMHRYLITIGYYNGLSPGQCQAIIWINAGIKLTGPFGINSSEILIKIHNFFSRKCIWKMSSAKWQPFCLSPNVLIQSHNSTMMLFVGGPIIHKEQQEEQCT